VPHAVTGDGAVRYFKIDALLREGSLGVNRTRLSGRCSPRRYGC
jgi:hypothetical protein